MCHLSVSRGVEITWICRLPTQSCIYFLLSFSPSSECRPARWQLQAKYGDAYTFQWTSHSRWPCCVAQLWHPPYLTHKTRSVHNLWSARLTRVRSRSGIDCCLAVFKDAMCLVGWPGCGEFVGYIAPASAARHLNLLRAKARNIVQRPCQRSVSCPVVAPEQFLSSELCPQSLTLAKALVPQSPMTTPFNDVEPRSD